MKDRLTSLAGWLEKIHWSVFAAGAVLLAMVAVQEVRAEVRINEFLADNQDGLVTADCIPADWIELANTG
ncbi:MAG TPA: hypothetical protein VN673_06240, partial [Clostridia bacterium]|nr:hypothetical protein [Clostridia bacterium]